LRPSESQRIIALGSDRAAKIAAVAAAVERIATVDAGWRKSSIVARTVPSNVAAMPLTDDELMRGARSRAIGVTDLLQAEGVTPDLSLGLEGGFHSVKFDGEWHTYLRGWAFATDGKRGWFGAAPAIEVPPSIARRVIDGKLELGVVIDEIAGEYDVRSRQGSWGVLSRDLLTRSMSFEAALIAALAPFYNAPLYA
jgi:non-canonical (house-cleaning) NTP pyrophosphatase